MNLFIEIKDGNPVNHPAFEENLIKVFGNVPSNWELFIRQQKPILPKYEVFISENPIYKKVNGVWTDVWETRPMTEEEIKEYDQMILEAELANSLIEVIRV